MDVAVDKHLILYTIVLACLCYCYFVSSRIKKGFFRLVSVLPVFYLFTILLHIPNIVITITSTLLLTSLANFQLSLFASGQGPPSSFRSAKSSKATKKSPVLSYCYIALEVLLSAILIRFLTGYQDKFHRNALLPVNCCLALLAVECLGAASNFMLHATVGVELEPPSDRPYLSTSLQDFWGKRWNLTVTNILRRTVYRPVRSASGVLLGNRLAPFAAVLATFLVSGLFHELFFYYLTRAKPSWEMTAFFVLHGFCVALEVAIKKAWNGRWGLPVFVSVPLTIGFVMLTSFWLFFPPLIRGGADTIVLEQFKTFVEFIQNELPINFGGHRHQPVNR